MNNISNIQQFLFSHNSDISLYNVLISLLVTAALSIILAQFYIKYGKSLSNRRIFAKNFILIGTTTMFIITIIKSSLALSLGLVGALSIVRFRTAVKEPEAISYLFLTIGIGLGMGANQPILTTSSFFTILFIMWIGQLTSKKDIYNNLYLTVTSHKTKKINLDLILKTLQKHCNNISIKRFDETKDALEVALYVDIQNFNQLNKSKKELQKHDSTIQFSFLDNKEH